MPPKSLDELWLDYISDSVFPTQFTWMTEYNRWVPLYVADASNGGSISSWGVNGTVKVFDMYIEDGNWVSSVGQGYFTKAQRDALIQDWNRISPILEIIAKNQTAPQYKAYCDLADTMESICNSTTPGCKKHPAAICRWIASLQPELLTTIVSWGVWTELYRHLSKFCTTPLPPWGSGLENHSIEFLTWFKKNISQTTIAATDSKFPGASKALATWPYQLYLYLKELQERLVAIKQMADFLKIVRNLIFHGAPGTGKTYLASKIAKEIIAGNKNPSPDEQIDFIQFHPSYDYTDFIEGLRPDSASGGSVSGFKLVKGVFKQFCENAAKDRDNNYVFIIDEINRGDISRIFGEAFVSIDPDYRDGKPVKTQYQNLIPKGDIFDKGFYVPQNVYVIGTMNDVDRSLESLDDAMRRRFTFKEITYTDTMSMLKCLVSNKYTSEQALIEKMISLNDLIEKRLGAQYQLGAAWFKKIKKFPDKVESFDILWECYLRGQLQEYLRGDPDARNKLEEFKKAYYEG